MDYITRDRLVKVLGAIATIAAVFALNGCNSTPPCNVDNKSIDCEASRASSSVAPSSSVKPTTSVSRTSSATPTTTISVPTTTRHLIATSEYPAGKLEKYSDGDASFSPSPIPTTTATPTTSQAPELAPTQQQPAQSRQFFTVHDQQGHMGNEGEEQIPSNTELYTGMGNPPSGHGEATLRSIGASTFSELEFQAPVTVPWSYIVVRRVGEVAFTGAKYNLSSDAVNALGGRVIYEFHGYDDIETIYFVR